MVTQVKVSGLFEDSQTQFYTLGGDNGLRGFALNRFFGDVLEEKPPPIHHGREVRIHYLTQATSRPPTFVLWANTPDGLAPAYKRFIANRLREAYGFRGTPIRIALKTKKDRHKMNE